jgi:acyl-CoA thioester hydrolase
MFTAFTQLRIRYAETDQMGVAYYGNYAQYYEVARVEAIRELGLTYKKLEEQGILMPVLENWSKYLKPAHYDELITIHTTVKTPPSTRITSDYEIKDESDTLIHLGQTTLVFYDKEAEQVCEAPQVLKEKLRPYFQNESN